MYIRLGLINLTTLALLTACSTSIVDNYNFQNKNSISNLKVKTSLSGKVEFPNVIKNNLSIKAVSFDISNSTVAILYPSTHKTTPNKTVATGLTDALGSFTINPNSSFNPILGDIFVLEASKRISSVGSSLISIRTYIKWNGTSWDSITTKKIIINSITTALAIMSNLVSPSTPLSNTIDTISIENGNILSSDIKNSDNIVIKADQINKVAKLVEFSLSKNYDPLQYLVYKNGEFLINEPKDIVNIVTTIVGSTNLNFWVGDNNQASVSKLTKPSDTILDSNGNIYIADTNNHRIRKIDKNTGIITTFAGTGVAGYGEDGIKATNSTLNFPNGIAFDSNENLYIADTNNYRIRKVDKITGIITTIAGNANFISGDGGQATNVRLSSPTDIIFDSNDNLYISELSLIKKVDKNSNIITTFAGTQTFGYSSTGGIVATTSLNVPSAIAFDSIGNLYIADTNNHRIKKVDKVTGTVTTVVGSGVAGFSGNGNLGLNAQLNSPSGIAFDSNENLYIADTNNHRIRKVDKITGIITTVAGNSSSGYGGDGGVASLNSLNLPSKLTFDSLGNMYIADSGNNRIRKVNKDNNYITTIAGGFSSLDTMKAIESSLNFPNSLSIDSLGNLFISDGVLIRKVDKTTNNISTFVGGGASSSNFMRATDVKLNSPQNTIFDNLGNMYIPDGNVIKKFDKATGLISNFVGNGIVGYNGENIPATRTNLNYPSGIAFDSNGNLYISEIYNNRIRKFDKATGLVSTFAGTGVLGYGGDSDVATKAKFNYPGEILFDSEDNLFITDTNNNRIRKIDKKTGIITTIAGTGIYGFNGEKTQATNAELKSPSGIAFDSLGNLYIADTYNNRIRKVDKKTNILSTIVGSGLEGFNGDANEKNIIQLRNPTDVNFDLSDNMYIVDRSNNRIRKLTVIPTIEP